MKPYIQVQNFISYFSVEMFPTTIVIELFLDQTVPHETSKFWQCSGVLRGGAIQPRLCRGRQGPGPVTAHG